MNPDDLNDLAFLSDELARASNIKPKPKLNPGPTKTKLVEKSIGFNEGFNSAEFYAKQQTGKTPEELA